MSDLIRPDEPYTVNGVQVTGRELAEARQARAHHGAGAPHWDELTPHERVTAVLEAGSWLRALHDIVGPDAPALPESWARLIRALTIMGRGPNSNQISPTNCSHDVLVACAEPSDFSDAELAQLEKLGFSPTVEGAFESTEFGSA